MSDAGPLQPYLDGPGVVLLDGGLATTLEARGHDLHGDLWSARLLRDDPVAVRGVHEDFLHAGADCLVAASYQASIPGFLRQGMSPQEARRLLDLSVTLAEEARDTFLGSPASRGRLRPLVAASIGPYAALLADASEYRGYEANVTRRMLRDFHAPRWEHLACSRADLLACETLPAALEVEVLLELIRETPDCFAWCSVSCRDGEHLRDGSRLAEALAGCDAIANLVAVGVNCTAPRHIDACLETLRRVTRKPLVVYPNSGETYDAARHAWSRGDGPPDWGKAAVRWHAAGAVGIGGCCRVRPVDIATMRRQLLPSGA